MSKAREISELGDAVTVDGSNVGIGTSSPATSLDVTGTVTADALTVDGDAKINSSLPNLYMTETDTTDLNTRFALQSGVQYLASVNDALTVTKNRISWDNSTGDISFYEDTGTTPKFFWDASAEALGIGTTASLGNLTVGDGLTGTKTIALNGSGSSTSAMNLDFRGGGSGNPSGRIGYSSSDEALTFHTGDFASIAERMRLDASGNLLVGTTTQYAKFNVSSGVEVGSFTNTSGTGNIRFRNSAGSTIGYIQWSGSSTSYVTSSDYRLKEDVQPMVGASDRVLALKPVNFAWKSDGTRVDGFLAHEAQAVVPEAVTGTKDGMRTEEYEVTPAVEATYDEDGNELTPYVPAVMGTREVPDYQGIDQSKLVPLLTAALQEALNEIAALKDRVAALEAN